MRNEGGFTIVELMIVVTIVGILSALAIPVYQSYVTRAKVAEAGQLAGPAQTAVLEYFLDHGQFPPDNAAVNLDPAAMLKGSYIGSIGIVNGTVTLTFADAALAGRSVTLIPSPAGAALTWTCATTLPEHLRPPICK